jgi:D-alanyl-D-alanine carboxypeptidase
VTRNRIRNTVRISVPTLAVLLAVTAAAVPAQAATATVASSAGVTWSQVMHRKLNLDAESVRLAVLKSGLRATTVTRTADLAKAQQTQRDTARTAATAASTDQHARLRYGTAKAAATAAHKVVITAQTVRPRSVSRTNRAKAALLAANTTVKAWVSTVGRTKTALKVAQTAAAAATHGVGVATTAYQSVTKAVVDTQQKIAAVPVLRAALAKQAAAIGALVVTQTRGNFTIAQTTQVYGVTVNKIVAYPFQMMIIAAARAGVPLSGGGFRTKQQQIGLRTTNRCPNVWTAPASSCKVPTAIPGRSLHELGLAIDLTSGNKAIGSHKSAAFIWLAANAGKYGFTNLPSEPWHWSITGS